MESSRLFALTILITFAIFVELTPAPAFAVPNIRPPSCVAPTQYYDAVEGRGPNFEVDVRRQGTGINRAGQLVRLDAATSKLKVLKGDQVDRNNRTCQLQYGEVLGAASTCLFPYFSIAADPKYYHMGEIIFIPQIRGKTFRNPRTGRMGTHNGYFMIGDTGGNIKGAGRFDFFIGRIMLEAPNNPFKDKGGFPMPDRKLNPCGWTYTLIRKNSASYYAAKLSIEMAYGNVFGYPPAPPHVAPTRAPARSNRAR